ncbi:hypothetical protein ECHHL_0126 [Ehrlichia chaffeensis str. Heartland]|uniref:hypothetical protein n=1 Tax=Ehrlichia chaffeensis TaxID=945 RepID=UPI00031FB463|nr:hypothetical protein [Ehrlichia chaffeensis]AHX03301.1 hypothetical protein ECHHL_0126 [Ehrlichia chaffeensis str. Heartland]AHX05218.1 hypothetical protein ECHJAX_0126 [Ehrlichia chaffeensis str. Jax]AHX06207.1 hypothetical protein ECHLIB_0126 [Ehrlichia chaffeensis str. Liberty]AHX08656.1 hypothetical protein ECHSTV_0126 [Ehrlichia chaffeensis str. Saint Vincent]AHX09073.1 hypothetical protein ECHWAK_0124 [Ehrlichia chaffeensis str. Wakulla]
MAISRVLLNIQLRSVVGEILAIVVKVQFVLDLLLVLIKEGAVFCQCNIFIKMSFRLIQ